MGGGVIAAANIIVEMSELSWVCALIHRHLAFWPRLRILLILLVQVVLRDQSTPIMDGEFCVVSGRTLTPQEKSNQSCAQAFGWCQSRDEIWGLFPWMGQKIGFYWISRLPCQEGITEEKDQICLRACGLGSLKKKEWNPWEQRC